MSRFERYKSRHNAVPSPGDCELKVRLNELHEELEYAIRELGASPTEDDVDWQRINKNAVALLDHLPEAAWCERILTAFVLLDYVGGKERSSGQSNPGNSPKSTENFSIGSP